MNRTTILGFIALTAAACLCVSCNPEAKAVSGLKVNIAIEPAIVSSGFMQFTFVPDKEAYYHVGIVPVAEMPDTANSSAVRAFMNLKLDEAYTNYIAWRHSLLEKDVPYIAEFPTHSLQYGRIDYNFTLLKPDTHYMVYAFVVDAKTNKPDGRLFTYTISTLPESPFEVMDFEYRVRGYWDYIYPVYRYVGTDLTEIIDIVPWVGATIDSLELVGSEYATVPEYFGFLFEQYINFQLSDWIHFGIYAHNNNGEGDGTSDTFFMEGHTYYTALTIMDGYLKKELMIIYKFHWQDESTQFYFTPAERLTTDW